MSFIKLLGEQAAGAATSVVGAGLGMALNKWNQNQQLKQEGRLQQQAMQGQMAMTDYNTAKQLEMWKQTGAVGQMEQLKKAGLNPGLIYGMGGAGGQSAGITPGQISQGHAAPPGGEVGMGIERMLQASLMKAQIDNINADTANKTGDAANKPIVGKNLEQDLLNKKMDEIVKDFAGKEAKAMYEEVNQPNRQMQARAKTDELSGISAEGQLKNEMWETGGARQKAWSEIKGLDLNNEKTQAEIGAITQRVKNETKLADNKVTDDAYYRMIHDVSDSLDLTVKSAADVLRIIFGFLGVKARAKGGK
ncbi:MAG: DNA pilot protein [Microviridae sp.]|nr:MAG: DNA pilot protein [Microviridae sp.]